MLNSAWSESDLLAAWSENETRHLDLVASWEAMLSIYDQLGFQDTLTDSLRLTEYKWIITEINKFLTRTRTALHKTRTLQDAIDYLQSQLNTRDTNMIKERQQLAFQKLRQQWVLTSIHTLMAQQEQLRQQELEQEREEINE